MNPSTTHADAVRDAGLTGAIANAVDRVDSDWSSAHMPAAHHVRRLARLFHKRAGEGLCTKPFHRFPQECRDRLLAASGLDGDEWPVLACRFSDQRWTLLTTKRLLWQKHTHRAALPLDAILLATLHHGEIARRHPELTVALTRLRIVTTQGHLYTIELEAGPSCFGFQHLMRKTTRMRPDASASP